MVDAFMNGKVSSTFDKERLLFRTLSHHTTEGRDMLRILCETLNSQGIYALMEEAYVRRLENAHVEIVVDSYESVHDLSTALSQAFDYDTDVWWLEDQVAYIDLHEPRTAEEMQEHSDTVFIPCSELRSAKNTFQSHIVRNIVLSRIIDHFYIAEYMQFIKLWTAHLSESERTNMYGVVAWEYLEKHKTAFGLQD